MPLPYRLNTNLLDDPGPTRTANGMITPTITAAEIVTLQRARGKKYPDPTLHTHPGVARLSLEDSAHYPVLTPSLSYPLLITLAIGSSYTATGTAVRNAEFRQMLQSSCNKLFLALRLQDVP